MKTVLLFGTGFIARNLIDYIEKGYPGSRIVVLYNHHTIEDHPKVKYYSMEEDYQSILEKERPDHIICLQGNSFVSANTDVIESVETNALKIMRFLEVIHQHKLYEQIEKILVIGSASEYGKLYDVAIQETFPLNPTSIYGLSKIYLYNGSMYYKERGLPITYVRQFNTIGNGQRKEFVLPSFCHEVISIEKGLKSPIIDVGDLSQERDFLDVRDTCQAYLLLLQKGEVGEVYNVASGDFVSVDTLLQLVIHNSSVTEGSVSINSTKNLFSKEESLSKRLQANITKLQLLGFSPKYTLDQTVKDALEYWRKRV